MRKMSKITTEFFFRYKFMWLVMKYNHSMQFFNTFRVKNIIKISGHAYVSICVCICGHKFLAFRQKQLYKLNLHYIVEFAHTRAHDVILCCKRWARKRKQSKNTLNRMLNWWVFDRVVYFITYIHYSIDIHYKYTKKATSRCLES